MQELDDTALLREYVERGSEPAFAALVGRHVHKVYSVALRHTRNPHSAGEITQAVFVILARKSRGLLGHKFFSGWLYETARLTAVTFLRSEIRRGLREQEAQMQTVLNENESEVWTQIAPLLDAAMAALNETDRHAVVLRFFDGKTMREVGAAMGANEDAAKKRVNRALEKLRKFFTKRGVVSTTTIIAGTISANSVQAAPAMLAKTATAVALAKGAAATTSTLILVKGALKLMAWTKMKITLATSAVVLLAAGTVAISVKELDLYKTDPHYPQTETAIAQIEAKLQTAYQPLPRVMIAPTKFPGKDMAEASDGYHLIGFNRPVKRIVELAFSLRGNLETRAIIETNLPDGNFDFNADMSLNSMAALQMELKKTLGVVGIVEKRKKDVLLLTLKMPNASKLKPSIHVPPALPYTNFPGEIFAIDQPLSGILTMRLENYFKMPIVDQTGLTNLNNRYDIKLTWDESDRNNPNPDGLKKALIDQLGLELVPTNMPIEMLVVEKAN